MSANRKRIIRRVEKRNECQYDMRIIRRVEMRNVSATRDREEYVVRLNLP